MNSFLIEAQDSVCADDSRSIEIVVVDDFPVVRHGICDLLASQQGFKVVGDAEDGIDGLRMTKATQPDILLLDLELNAQQYSYDFISKIVSGYPTTKVVVYTGYYSENLVLEAIRCGASAYVIKSSHLDRLYEAIRAVAGGGSYLDPGITSLVIGKIGRRQDRRTPNSRELTKREREVLEELVSGKRNREIAENLFISERTVKYHIKSMFAKLHAKSRTEVVKIAIRNGFV